jgi:hypothetical protein
MKNKDFGDEEIRRWGDCCTQKKSPDLLISQSPII